MQTISISALMQSPEAEAFWAIRGKAIHAFAQLEQATCRLFEAVSRIPSPTATVIFSKIADKRAQSDIILKLLTDACEEEFRAFPRSILKLAGTLAKERNEIAHWNLVTTVAVGNDTSATWALVPQSGMSASGRSRTQEDLVVFTAKCMFLYEACIAFAGDLKSDLGLRGAPPTSQDRYREPIVYPSQVRIP